MKQTCLLLFCVIGYGLMTTAHAEKQPQTEDEKLSYVLGVLAAQNILQQPIKLDAESFMQAITDVLKQSDMKMTGPEMQQVFNGYREKQLQLQKEFQQQASKNKTDGDAFLAENKKKSGIVELPSGLQYRILKQGSGKKPTLSDTVEVHYRGTLLDGKVFDSSYKREQSLRIPLNGVIKGWQEALPMMATGSKWQIYVPSHLGYGAQGAPPDIQPNSTLIFDIELISVN